MAPRANSRPRAAFFRAVARPPLRVRLPQAGKEDYATAGTCICAEVAGPSGTVLLWALVLASWVRGKNRGAAVDPAAIGGCVAGCWTTVALEPSDVVLMR